MATYVFESSRADRIELDYPMGHAPSSVDLDGETFKRIIVGVQTLVAGPHKASNDGEIADGRAEFVSSGDAWLVKHGHAKTGDMDKARQIINSVPESHIVPPAQMSRRAVSEATAVL